MDHRCPRCGQPTPESEEGLCRDCSIEATLEATTCQDCGVLLMDWPQLGFESPAREAHGPGPCPWVAL